MGFWGLGIVAGYGVVLVMVEAGGDKVLER